MSNKTDEARNHGRSNSTLQTDKRRMGATEAGTSRDAEWHLLDRPEHGSVAGLAEMVRTIADGVPCQVMHLETRSKMTK